jgi:hypothetical protein
MNLDRRALLQAAAAGGLVAAASACTSKSSPTTSSTQAATGHRYSLRVDHTAWHYDATNDVYWQISNVYVATPAASEYENLAVYVPGAYFTATKNSKGTYTAAPRATGAAGKYTAATAPIVIPVNTPGYAAQRPPTSYSYSDVSAYLKAGFIYVAPGLRGRDSSTSTRNDDAPWGVTDLKAAVRYVRYNASLIPGDKARIVVFGMSGGGAQSSVLGASGDSPLYTPYLKSLGAAMTTASGTKISDAVAGVMAWCPITSLDMANASYEWNMGQFAATGTRASGTWTSAYSADLAKAWAPYVNRLKLKDASGKKLTLSKSGTGLYLSGSYYDHLVSVVATSLNDFLHDTTFPYTQSALGAMSGGAPGSGGAPSGGSAPSGGAAAAGGSGTSGKKPSGGMPAGSGPGSGGAPGTSGTSKTFKTVDEYIAYLNKEEKWVDYDSSAKTAKVLSLSGFVKSQKNASKDVGAFDGIDRGETENLVHGLGTNPLHFAAISHDVVAANQSRYSKYSAWKPEYDATQYTSDFAKTDSVGRNVLTRENAYNPMFFLSSAYTGHETGKVAPHWRIRTGIAQGDTANTTEVNLTLALQNYGVDSVDFATVWAAGHTMAERTGSPTTNFIEWVERTVGGK